MNYRFRALVILAMLFLGGSVFAQRKVDPQALPLRALAAKQQLLVGAASTRGKLNNPKFKALAAREFNSLTVENELKCASVAYHKDSFMFKSPDYIINWAEANGMKVRGHTLIWHSSVPKWLSESGWSKEQVLAFLKEYITTVVSRYKGRIYAWDVVNEIFEDTGKLRQNSSFWYKACGEDYIEKAFIWAHEADPNVKLFINDYNVEMFNAKSTATYELVKKLLAKGVPVHGFGMQAHMTVGGINFKSIAKNIRRFTDLGLEVHITELDVRIPGVGTPEQFKQQAENYRGFFTLAMDNPGVTSITTWGATDRDSWIAYTYKGYGAPLLFDGEYQPKPAYFAVTEVLTQGRHQPGKK